MPYKLNCLYQNTRGLRTKIAHGLRNRISNTEFHIVALTETWLNESFPSESIFDGDLFVVHRSDRTSRTYTRPTIRNNDDLRGGGSLIAIKKNIPTVRMTDWEIECPYDNVWLNIITNDSSKLFINCIYVNDKTTFESFMIYLDLLVDIINRREPNAKFIILGDFNLSCIEWYYENDRCLVLNGEGRMANELLNMLACTELKQTNHIKNAYNRTLDLILTNMASTKCKKVVGIVTEDPYHPALGFKFDSGTIKFMKMKKTNKLNFFKANYEAINHDLAQIDWDVTLNGPDINSSVDSFYGAIKQIIQKHTPKSFSSADNYPIWYSRQLIQLNSEKEAYYKLK